jgi:hypothetical protein
VLLISSNINEIQNNNIYANINKICNNNIHVDFSTFHFAGLADYIILFGGDICIVMPPNAPHIESSLGQGSSTRIEF